LTSLLTATHNDVQNHSTSDLYATRTCDWIVFIVAGLVVDCTVLSNIVATQQDSRWNPWRRAHDSLPQSRYVVVVVVRVGVVRVALTNRQCCLTCAELKELVGLHGAGSTQTPNEMLTEGLYTELHA
jgi:hypothetical protein